MKDNFKSRTDTISQLLSKRFAVYPKRDRSYSKLCEALIEFSNYLRSEIDFSTFNPNLEVIQAAENFSTSPIFICGPMKSGTSLLTQLLDNHPDLLVMPGDSHYIHHSGKWDRGQFDEISAFWLKRLINPTGKKPFWFIGPDRSQLETFLLYLQYFLSNTSRDIFLCVIMAVDAANAKTSTPHPKRYWVEKTPHNELDARELKSRFPNAKFLHILRDPLENIASLKRMSEIRNQNTTSFEYARLIRKLFRAAEQNQVTFGRETYFTLKYEDLVADPERVLDAICGFLDISFHETLLEPTENGRPGISNSMFPENMVTGRVLDLSKQQRYKELLNKSELKDIVTIVYQDAMRAGYQWNDPAIECYRRPLLNQHCHNLMTRIKLRLSRF